MSWRDIVLAGGGLFLLVKGTMEMHHMLEGYGGESAAGTASFAAVIAQIVMLDVVFSLDSVITASASPSTSRSWSARSSSPWRSCCLQPSRPHASSTPTLRSRCWRCFLLLVGVALIADGLHYHIPRGYLYFGIAFSIGVDR